MSRKRKKMGLEKVSLDPKKLSNFFNSAVAKLTLQSPESNTEKHPLVTEILDKLKNYTTAEKLVLLTIVASRIYVNRDKELSEPENLEALSFAIFHSLAKSQVPGNLLFIVGRISERALRLFPDLAGALDKEMLKILSGAGEEPKYIS